MSWKIVCAATCALQRRVHPGLQRLELSGSNSVAINPCTVGRVQALQQLRLFRVFGANALHLWCMKARQDGLRACWGRRLVMLCPTVWFQSVPVAMPVTNLVMGRPFTGVNFSPIGLVGIVGVLSSVAVDCEPWWTLPIFEELVAQHGKACNLSNFKSI